MWSFRPPPTHPRPPSFPTLEACLAAFAPGDRALVHGQHEVQIVDGALCLTALRQLVTQAPDPAPAPAPAPITLVVRPLEGAAAAWFEEGQRVHVVERQVWADGALDGTVQSLPPTIQEKTLYHVKEAKNFGGHSNITLTLL